MKGFIQRIFLLIIYLINVAAFAQRNDSDNAPVTFEELYDEPYEINKLFLQFQPIYGDMFVTNINAGFGVEVTYYLEDKLDFRASARKTYTRQFDVARNLSEKNSIFTLDRNGISNVPQVYNYFEIGATYHIEDFEEDSETKMYLYKKSYKGDRWAARVPKYADIPSKVRKIYGARLGGMLFNSSTDLKRAIDKQEVSYSELMTADGAENLENFIGTDELADISLYGNVNVAGLYVGGSIAWIHNIAVDFDNKYQVGVDDLILTAFFDIMFAPSVTVDDIIYTQRNSRGVPITQTFLSDPINTTKIGFRLGLDGKFNRTLSWGYGAEIGTKPTIKGRNAYALIKISFPIYSTNLQYKVEAFGK